MKTLLVHTDNPSDADMALRVASAIAAKTGVKIQRLPVSDFISHRLFQYPDAVMPATGHTTINGNIDLVVIGANLIGGRYELTGDTDAEGTKGAAPATGIILDAQAEGTKGAFAAHEVPFDPVVAKAIKSAHCPVLTIIQADGNFEITSAVLVTDFEKGSAPLFQQVKELQQVFSCKLFILHVNAWYHHESPDVLEIKLKELADRYALTNASLHILDDYTYEEGIMHFSQKVKADMIAMPIDMHKDISRLLSENLQGEATRHQAKCLLTFNVK